MTPYTRWNKIEAAICIVIFTFVVWGLLSGCTGQRVRIDTAIHTTCTDMPCWDCHTMGNHVCGTTEGNK